MLSPRIKHLLESAYSDFHSHYHRERDPVSLAHRYCDPRDRESAAFFAALLAYGNVQTILGSATRLLDVLGPSPHRSLIDQTYRGGWKGFRHRFTTGQDIEILATWLSGALRSHGTIEAFFVGGGLPASSPMKALLSDFVRRLERQSLPPELEQAKRHRQQSLKYLLSDPERGSACKRLNMYLRWMVRAEDGIDLGLWRALSSRQLMLPVDTHLLQTLRALRWTRSKQATWKVCEAATSRLRRYAPEDPIRYDFALCHLSMAGGHVLDYVARERKTVTHAALER